jgi:hypothetical protein
MGDVFIFPEKKKGKKEKSERLRAIDSTRNHDKKKP